MKVKVVFGKEKKVKVNPTDLLSASLQEVLSDKIGRDIPASSIVSFDGTTAVVVDGEEKFLDIDENDLIDQSIKDVVKKTLKTRKKFDVAVVKN